MILDQLSRAERQAYETALQATEIETKIEVTIRDRDEKAIGSLTAEPDWEKATYRGIPGVIEGQIDVDMSADVTHQCSLTVTDPKGKLEFDPDTPAQSGLFVDKFVSVRHLLKVGDEYHACPVFWGSVTKFDRQGSEVSIEGMGKEALALEPCLVWATVKLHKGMLVTEAIKKVMRAQGERRFDLPNVQRKLHRDITVARGSEAWRVASRLANSIDMQLFYDGAGRCRLRRWSDDPTLVFREGETLLTHPSISYDFDRVRNVVEVLGSKPERNVPRIRAVAYAPRSHPLSAHKLARNGEPRWLVERVENNLAARTKTVKTKRKGKEREEEKVIQESVVKSRKRAREIAARRLDNLLNSFIDASYEVLVHPHLEVGDTVGVRSTYGDFTHRLKTYSLPLGIGAGQSVGFNKRLRMGAQTSAGTAGQIRRAR